MSFDHLSLEGTLVILCCSECGDTFPVEEGQDATCRSCGSANLDLAVEPLL